MRGIKILVIGTLIAVAQPSLSQSSFGLGLSLSYNQGRGAYPIGWGNGGGNFGQINQCFNSQYFNNAANAYSYGPGYGPGFGPGNGPGFGPGFGPGQNAFSRPMPQMPVLPALAPPTPYVRQAPQMSMNQPSFMQGPCNFGCMPPPPPCGACNSLGIRAAGQYAGNGVFFGADGQVIIDDRGIMEWEKNDTGGIVSATGGVLLGLSSNVVPYAPYVPYRNDRTVFSQSGVRLYDVNERPLAH